MTTTMAQPPAISTRGGRPLRICVFCGAAPSNSELIVHTAKETGRLVGERGHHLVYGGGGSGLMGQVAWAAAEHGASIRGVIPHFLYERERTIAAPRQELQITETLQRRKEHMLHSADAFIALPGGYGTLDEIVEVLSASYLGTSAAPLVIVNTEGIWDGLIGLLDTLTRFELISAAEQPPFHSVPTPEQAISLIEDMLLTRSGGSA
jgi:uncharacterized protein (TIGR00730 family)